MNKNTQAIITLKETRDNLNELKQNIIGLVIVNNKIDGFIYEFSECGKYFSSFKITPMLALQTEHDFPCASGFYRILDLGGETYEDLLNDPKRFIEFLKDNKIER